ncbi:hypothetical protein GCM10027202_13630 [Microvirgula curvata]
MVMSGKERVVSKRMVLEVSIVIACYRLAQWLPPGSMREMWVLLLRGVINVGTIYYVLLNVCQFLLWLYVQATRDEP